MPGPTICATPSPNVMLELICKLPLALISPEAVMWLPTVKSPSFIVNLEGLVTYASDSIICTPFVASMISPSDPPGPVNLSPKIVPLALILPEAVIWVLVVISPST